MKHKKYLLLDPKLGYPFGVLASSKGPFGDELHGPFKSHDEARDYGRDLVREYSDYTDVNVVKIEVPHVSTIKEAS